MLLARLVRLGPAAFGLGLVLVAPSLASCGDEQAGREPGSVAASGSSTRHQALALVERPHGFHATLDDGRLRARAAPEAPPWSLELTWSRIGRGAALRRVEAPAAPVRDGARTSLRREDGSAEWFEDTEAGLEHGWVLPARAPGDAGELVLELALGGELSATSGTQRGSSVTFTGPRGDVRIHYSDLHAHDADGRALPATMVASGAAIRLLIDDAAARYPVVVDPLLWVEQQELLPTGSGFQLFGDSVALEGDTAAVGASGGFGNPSNAGKVYVFSAIGRLWSLEQQLVPSDAVAGDSFGNGVALGGDTIVAGAPLSDNPVQNAGSAYAFVRSGGVWSEQQKLMPADPTVNLAFGTAVALSGDTVAIGGYEPSLGSGSATPGAYVFVRSGTAWTQEQKVVAQDAIASGGFGASIALDGDTMIVGAPEHTHSQDTKVGAAYVFVRSAGVWTEQQELMASDAAEYDQFGFAVALDGDTAVVGTQKPNLGETGAAYVFVRAGSTWTEQQKLVTADAVAENGLGWSLAVEGDRTLVAAIDHDGTGTYRGAAYLFTRATGVWTEEQRFTASDGVDGDWFGHSVALSGNRALVGARSAEPSGSAYVFALATTGGPCTSAGDCDAGWCVDGVCCDLPCGGGDPTDCLACSVTAGAAVDGTCTSLTGTTCDDGAFCNGTETCSAGVCAGSTGDPCPGPDGDESCAESCDETARACTAADPEGAPCTDGACQSGTCQPPVPSGGGGAAGSAGSGGGSNGAAVGDGGCGCRVGSARSSGRSLALLGFVTLWALAARRRARGACRVDVIQTRPWADGGWRRSRRARR